MSHAKEPSSFKEKIQSIREKLEREQTQYLESLYNDPSHPASFGGVDVLYDYVKSNPSKFNFTKRDILQFLESQPHYTERVNKKRPSVYPRVIVPGVNHLVEMDVAYMPKAPGGKKFILAAIDAFSKKVKTVALTTLKANVSTPAAMELIEQLGGTRYLRTDKGSEFINTSFNEALKKYGIVHYFARSVNKSVHAERFFRTFKQRLLRAAKKTKKSWVKLLDDVTDAYNNKKHRSIGDTPNEIAANQAKAADLWFK